MIDWALNTLSVTTVGALFLMLLMGLLLGQIRVFGLSLGSSGVLFAALVAGHFGLVIPSVYGSLGVIFFVYAVGLQAGPRFIHTIRTNGPALVRIGLLIIVLGASAAVVLGKLFGLSPGMIVGAFAGAMTSTPALAAGVEVFRQTDPEQLALIAVSYGMAYPFGVAGVVLPVQIVPKLLARGGGRKGESAEPDEEEVIQQGAFRVENPNVIGLTVADANLWDFASVSISRILHGDEVVIVQGSTVLKEGDAILAVGTTEDFRRLELVLGRRIDPERLLGDDARKLTREDVFVEPNAPRGLSTAMLAVKHGVSITRVFRQGIPLVVGRDMELEPGDRIRAVGEPAHLAALEAELGHSDTSIFETDMLGLAAGLLAGVVLGLVPWYLSENISSVKLGLAGGPLLVSLLVGHFGRIGPMTNRVPASARFLLRELGLVLFLAYAGASAGARFVETFRQSGPEVLATSLAIVTVPVVLGFVVAYYVYRYERDFSLGLVCGGMTSTPALGALVSSVQSQEPVLGYASIYPLALIGVTVVAQMMALLL